MGLERICCTNRDEWLAMRDKVGIGASEAAVVAGISPYSTPLELWQVKTGAVKKRDISNNAAVAKGVAYEPALREMYKAGHTDYTVEYHAFDILYQSDIPFLFATLDGEIKTADGRNGVLETKTATPRARKDWDAWNNRIPDHYYCQVCHQLLATGYDFVDLYAGLFDLTNSEIVVREYHMERSDMLGDMEWLFGKELAFIKCVEEKRIPALTI